MKKKIFGYFFSFIVLIFIVLINFTILSIFIEDTVTKLAITNLAVPIELVIFIDKILKFLGKFF